MAFKDFINGMFKNNPVFILMLGLCPTLAVSVAIENALGMGISVIFVLTLSNALIASLRKFIPNQVRIPCFIVVIATLVTIIDLTMHAYLPPLYETLGIYVPLIVVNCIILGRAEAFASKNSVLSSALDGLGNGIGFTLAILLISLIRETLGSGTLTIWGDLKIELFDNAARVLVHPSGAFFTIAILMALFTFWGNKKRKNKQKSGGEGA